MLPNRALTPSLNNQDKRNVPDKQAVTVSAFTDWLFLVLVQDLAVAAVHVGHVDGVSICPVHLPAKKQKQIRAERTRWDAALITATHQRTAWCIILWVLIAMKLSPVRGSS